MSSPLSAFVVLCPLYETGSLEGSRLIYDLSSIERSRVKNKLPAYKAVLGSLADYFNSIGIDLKVKFAFADKGILLSHDPGEKEHAALYAHSSFYRTEVERFANSKKVGYEYLTFSDLDLKFPRFSDTRLGIPEDIAIKLEINRASSLDEHTAIACINEYLKSIQAHTVIESGKLEIGTVRQLTSIKDFPHEMLFGFIANYIALQEKIPDHVGEDGIFIQAERFNPLLKVPNLVEGLKALTRIDILA